MIKKIVKFFKEIYSNDIGTYDPKAEKIKVRDVLYLVIGFVVSLIISSIFVYIEVGEFDWNVFRFLWGEEETANLAGGGLYRGGHFVLGLSGNMFLVIAGFITTYKINGHIELLEMKRLARFAFPICYAGAITSFIIACIIY